MSQPAGVTARRFTASKTDRDEVRELIQTSYALIAPKRLAAQIAG